MSETKTRTYSKGQISKMNKGDLKKVIDRHKLDVNTDVPIKKMKEEVLEELDEEGLLKGTDSGNQELSTLELSQLDWETILGMTRNQLIEVLVERCEYEEDGHEIVSSETEDLRHMLAKEAGIDPFEQTPLPSSEDEIPQFADEFAIPWNGDTDFETFLPVLLSYLRYHGKDTSDVYLEEASRIVSQVRNRRPDTVQYWNTQFQLTLEELNSTSDEMDTATLYKKLAMIAEKLNYLHIKHFVETKYSQLSQDDRHLMVSAYNEALKDTLK